MFEFDNCGEVYLSLIVLFEHINNSLVIIIIQYNYIKFSSLQFPTMKPLIVTIGCSHYGLTLCLIIFAVGHCAV